MTSVKITVLVENTAVAAGLLAEHGLACWFEVGSRSLLFDTGQGMALRHNAQRMHIALQSAEAVVLSHGHYDHSGGLSEILTTNSQTRLYAHPDCLDAKYICPDSTDARDVGMPDDSRRIIEQFPRRWCQTVQPTEVVAPVVVTGPIPRTTDFEDTGGPFFQDGDRRHADRLVDDQALYFLAEMGVVVLLGCAHAGVINTLRYVQQLAGGHPIHTVLGGMHLVQASQTRLERTIQELRKLGVQRLGPAHCTGSKAVAALYQAFPGQCYDFHVGTQLQFPLTTHV